MKSPSAAHVAYALFFLVILAFLGACVVQGNENSDIGFHPTGGLSVPRNAPMATLLLDGSVLVTGGFGPDSQPVPGAERYLPAREGFGATGGPLTPRFGHVAVRLADGKVLIAGGEDGMSAPLASAELYNPVLETFTPTGALLSPRTHAGALLMPDGRVLVAGGRNASGDLTSTEWYDPSSGTFSLGPTLLHPHVFPSLAPLAGGSLLILAERYDPSDGQFHEVSGLPFAFGGATPIVGLPGDKVLAVGGDDGAANATALAFVYDPGAGTFAPTGSMGSSRAWHQAVGLISGSVLVVGGRSGTRSGGHVIASAERYDPATGTFSASGVMGTPRANHAAVRLLDGHVLVLGGNDGTNVLASAELY